MTSSLMLDTNTYYLLFHRPKTAQQTNLEKLIKTGSKTCFFISEITSMEIHSVLGKHRRGGGLQICKCERSIIIESETSKCDKSWITQKNKTISRRLYRDLQKLVKEAESCIGVIEANVLELSPEAINEGKRMLAMYSDRFNFGSHDALIAGTYIIARKTDTRLVLATSDKGLKAALKADSIPYFDPRI